MKQQLVELERIHFSRAFPWVHLFQSFRIALDIRKMLLAALALLVLSGGLYAVSYLPLSLTEREVETLRHMPWDIEPMATVDEGSTARIHWKNAGAMLTAPLLSVVQPAFQLIEQPMTWSGAALRWTEILWGLLVWSFFGTAISRMAAVQFAVDERVSLKEAGRFAAAKCPWVLSAPLMPIAGLLLLWLLCVAGGWIARLPGAGPVIVGLFWIVPLVLAFGMVLVLIGLILGWPLMVATISTQGSDAFDGFSRSFDYVYSRFWHLLWFLLVAAVHGILMLLLVTGVAALMADLAANFVSLGMAADFSKTLDASVPRLFNSLRLGEPFAAESSFAIRSVSFWLHVLALLVAGYAVSYFWTASTIIYFLLRQSEDANHLSEVYRPKMESSDELLQLAGVAASEQPIIERPAKHEPDNPHAPTNPNE